MPSADFCAAFGGSPPSRQSDHKGHGRQRRRPPEVSLTAFRTQPPEFTWGALDGYGLRESHARSSRARPPQIRFLYIGSCVCSTLPSDPTSRLVTPLRLATHLHQVGRGLSPPSDQTCSAQVGQASLPVEDARASLLAPPFPTFHRSNGVVPDLRPALPGISDNVIKLLGKLPIIANDPVEGLILPDAPKALMLALHLPGGERLPGMQNRFELVPNTA